MTLERKRFYAFLIDFLIVNFISSLVVGLIGNRGFREFETDQFTLILLPISTLIIFMYYVFCDASKFQGTMGKLIFKIKVVDEQAKKLTLGASIKRSFSRLLSAAVLYIGFIYYLFNKKKLAFHDIISHTRVIQA